MPTVDKKDFYLIVEGDIEVEKFITAFKDELYPSITRGFTDYVVKHLIPRIKMRLSQAIEAHDTSTSADGIIKASGGYGVKKNHERYAKWKSSRTNLPSVGGVSVRTLVATGQLLDSVNINELQNLGGTWAVTIGSEGTPRPQAIPFSGPTERGPATISGSITDLELWGILEDKGYKVWTVEYEDVRRDAEVLAVNLIKEVAAELAKKYLKKAANNV